MHSLLQFAEAFMKGTPADDRWALNVMSRLDLSECGSYRYADPQGVTHRAVWKAPPSGWVSCCDEKVVEKLQEGDAGAVTCVRCLWAGA